MFKSASNKKTSNSHIPHLAVNLEIDTVTSESRKPDKVAIGARLRHARLVKSLLIKELAQRVGVSASLILKYENDKLLSPLRVLHRLVSKLQTDISSLFDSSWSEVGYVASDDSRTRISAAGNGNLPGVSL